MSSRVVRIDVVFTRVSARFFAIVGALVALQGGCGRTAPSAVGSGVDATSSAGDAADRQGKPSAPPLQAERRASVPVTLACGRANAALPTDAVIAPERLRLCVDSGYAEDVLAVGVAGGRSEHVVRLGACDLKLSAGERMPALSATEPVRETLRSDGEPQVQRSTPEGSTFYVRIAPLTTDCPHERARLVQSLEQSLRVNPLREPGAHVRATISSAGHGFEMEVPAGFFVVSAGGMADQYETAYQLRGPHGAWATLYTSWRNFSAAPGPFIPTLLASRARWRTPAIDLATDVEDCRSTVAKGPDKRLKVELTMCGTPEAQAELEPLLASVRLTPPLVP